MGGVGLLSIMTVMVIYTVHGILYESFIHPITILSGLTSAGLGALIAQWTGNLTGKWLDKHRLEPPIRVLLVRVVRLLGQASA